MGISSFSVLLSSDFHKKVYPPQYISSTFEQAYFGPFVNKENLFYFPIDIIGWLCYSLKAINLLV